MFTRRLRPYACSSLVLLALLIAATAAFADPPSFARNDRVLTVMTRNLDEGTDFGPLFTATTQLQFAIAAANVFLEVQASRVAERAARVADEIAASQPDLVGLQEATIFRTGALLSPPAATVASDALQSLLDALAARGQHYAPVAIVTNSDDEAPTALGIDVRVTNRDVVLARTDLPESEFRLLGADAQHFAANMVFATPVLGAVTVPRGWIAVDAEVRGKADRFITTHLESNSSAVRAAQALELINGPGHTTNAVIMAGDFNSDADSANPLLDEAYQELIAAGYVDAWTATHPGDPGYTWPLHCEDTYTPCSVPDTRIDLVLSRGPVSASGADLVGSTPADLTASGLWPSDHAGVVASFVVEP